MKNLVESLFDDNIKKDVLFGDILEIENWECAGREDETMLEVVMNSNFSDWRTGSYKKIRELTKKSPWKQFLKPFESVYEDPDDKEWKNERYWYNKAFWYFTWVVMCCKSIKEVKEKLTEFINASRNSEMEVSRHRMNEPIEKVEVAPLEGLDDMKGMPRLVVIKFKIKGKDIVVYMKLKKRD